MDTTTSTYSPQSPDLSGFLASPSKSQQVYNPNSYVPLSPTIPSFNTAPPAQPGPTSTYHQPNAFPPTQPQLDQPQSHQHNALFGAYNPNPPTDSGLGINDFAHHTFQIPDLPPQNIFSHPTATQSIPTYYTPQDYQPQTYQPPYNPSGAHHLSEDSSYLSADPISSPAAMSSRQPRAPKPEPTSPAQYKDPNPTNIEIRTKFPVARIKRIMQADEEVGKVAQVTPVAVSKALELFMIALVTGAAEKAKEKGGKRVTAQHLKAVVLGSPEQFDFLADIVGRVAEVTEGAGGEGRKKGGKKEASESASEEEEKQVKKKAKGKGGRRKKVEQE